MVQSDVVIECSQLSVSDRPSGFSSNWSFGSKHRVRGSKPSLICIDNYSSSQVQSQKENKEEKTIVSAIQRQKKSTKDQDKKLEENEEVNRPRPMALLRLCSVIHVCVRISKACSAWWVSSSRAFPTWWVRSSRICSAWLVRSSKASLIKSKTGQRPGHTQTKVLPFPPSRG